VVCLRLCTSGMGLGRRLYSTEPLNVRHGSRSRAPSFVCSLASAMKGVQRCPHDKPRDNSAVLCKNWVTGIVSADFAVVGLRTLGPPRQSTPQLCLRCRPSSQRQSPGAPKLDQPVAEAQIHGSRRGRPHARRPPYARRPTGSLRRVIGGTGEERRPALPTRPASRQVCGVLQELGHGH